MIRRALIPTAGLATRLGPIGRAVPKVLLPLPGPGGGVQPVLVRLIDELRAAGIEHVGLIVSPGQQEMIQQFIQAAEQEAPLGVEVTCIPQPSPEGFGHAVLCSRATVGDEAFVLVLADHIRTDGAAATQVVRAFESLPQPAAVVGMHVVPARTVSSAGVASGQPVDGALYRCTALIEKPSPAVARKQLITPGLPNDHFLAHAGVYAFSSEIFDCLNELDNAGERPLELSAAQAMLLSRHPQAYYLFRMDGRVWDIGTAADYVEAFAALTGRTETSDPTP